MEKIGRKIKVGDYVKVDRYEESMTVSIFASTETTYYNPEEEIGIEEELISTAENTLNLKYYPKLSRQENKDRILNKEGYIMFGQPDYARNEKFRFGVGKVIAISKSVQYKYLIQTYWGLYVFCNKKAIEKLTLKNYHNYIFDKNYFLECCHGVTKVTNYKEHFSLRWKVEEVEKSLKEMDSFYRGYNLFFLVKQI